MVAEPWLNWHCVWVDMAGDEYEVKCLPHGFISRHSTHLAALKAALDHDWKNGTASV